MKIDPLPTSFVSLSVENMNIRVVVLVNIELWGLGPILVPEENYRIPKNFVKELTVSRKIFREDLQRR